MPTAFVADVVPAPPPVRTVAALGASLGGVEAIARVLAALPAGFAGAVLVVQHLSPRSRSHLAELLGRVTPLRVAQARDGERVEAGAVYVAPPGRHLRAELDGTLSLSDGPRVRYSRPAADVLFTSVAEAYGAAAVAVVLTGGQHDGADGVVCVHAAGGTVIAQDPRGAQAPGMPENSIRTGAVDLVLPLDEIGPALARIAQERA